MKQKKLFYACNNRAVLQIQRLNNFEMNEFFWFLPTEAIKFQCCSFQQNSLHSSSQSPLPLYDLCAHAFKREKRERRKEIEEQSKWAAQYRSFKGDIPLRLNHFMFLCC